MNSERREEIISYLSKKTFVTVKDMAALIHVSEPTIRRDFSELEKEGILRRNHGGATYLSDAGLQWPFTYRNRSNIDEKSYIASLASAYIEDGNSIFLDSGSTCYCMAKELANFDSLRVLSHGHPALEPLSMNETTQIECIGGTYDAKNDAVYGFEALNFINRRHADICITSGYALNLEYGVMDTFEEGIPIKQSMAANADKVILLIDSSKYGQTAYYQALSLDQIDVIISEEKLPKELTDYCDEHGIEYDY